ncbi:MAG TPA: AMP-binding protein [Candidatus Limnocylindrales bacterium]|nr:AMP-binding protein [Candidatus Limnocylindrales bacterium]
MLPERSGGAEDPLLQDAVPESSPGHIIGSAEAAGRVRPLMSHASLTELFNDLVRLGRGIAYVQKHGYRREARSYAQLAAAALLLEGELEARGINPGDNVLLWGRNSAEWVAAFWAILLRGAVAVPMDVAATPEFVRRVIEQAGVKLLLQDGERPELGTNVPSMDFDSVRDVSPGAPTIKAHAPCPGDRSTRETVAQIVFTSGTTAEPRGVVLTHGNILANLEPLAQGIRPYLKYERFFHPLRFVNLLPLSHVFGQFLSIFIPPVMGATVVIEESLNPSEVMRTIRRERATLLIAVPRVLDALRGKIERDLDNQGKRAWFESRFRAAEGKKFLRRAWKFRRIHRQFGWKFWAFLSGGAALSAVTETFFNRMGYAVIQGYGLTETTSLVSVNHPFQIGQGSIGKILPGREIKLGEGGEILVRGDSIAAGYWEGGRMRPAGEDGWFRTGDIGALDAAGNLYFKGRKKNVIVTPAGMNVYPEDLEAALRRDAAVTDCAVVALEQEGNAEPCAVLLLKERPGGAAGAPSDAEQRAAQVVERANRELAEYQRMRRWLVWPEADFPRTSTGKPQINIIAETTRRAFGADAGPQGATQHGQPGQRASVLADLIARVTARPSVAGQSAATAASGPNLEIDLNLSSLDRVELMSAIEDRFQIDLNETRFSEAKTVADIDRLLQGSSQRRSDYRYPRWTQRFPVTWIRVAIYYLLVWPATHILAHPRVRGRENLRGVRGPLLMVSNHVTRRTDMGFLMAALPLRFRHRVATTIGGETLQKMRHPPREWFFLKRCAYGLGYWLVVGLFNVFPLPQLSGFRESFQFAGESVDRGYSVLVFPEGELTPDGKLHPFQTGVGLLARNLRLPVVPMRIDGLWEVKLTGWRVARPCKVRVIIGPPVAYPPETPPEEIARDLHSRVAAL